MEEQKKNPAKKPVKKKKFSIKNMGLDIDKNEYYEIILSNSNHPESVYNRKN